MAEFEWYDINLEDPPDGKEVLVYTDDGKMRVCIYFNGRWNTYLKITHWAKLPKRPDNEIVEVKKKGRPKKQ